MNAQNCPEMTENAVVAALRPMALMAVGLPWGIAAFAALLLGGAAALMGAPLDAMTSQFLPEAASQMSLVTLHMGLAIYFAAALLCWRGFPDARRYDETRLYNFAAAIGGRLPPRSVAFRLLPPPLTSLLRCAVRGAAWDERHPHARGVSPQVE